ncbi:MAG: deoxyhypusine synthase family protein [Kiritimatiellae bacterium]|nr:deoxyhypusine synthase family protein [Kiritimatiellia bacterium]MCO5062003.1 deoxyhypusine synthase family protein [Kiritimatiellia bacterium]MCO6400269.1 deoxyhypusine synthase family protein [Verrucomicrobiota bacterium]
MAGSKFLKKKIVPLDPEKTETVEDVVAALGRCSFQGRSLAHALDAWEAMARDRRCLRVMSLAGAMVPAGMGLLVVRLIERGLLDVLICTGATLSHDLCNTVARDEQAHYLGDEKADDLALREQSINRIYDTYLPERGFDTAEDALAALLPKVHFAKNVPGRRTVSTQSFFAQIGRHLPGRSILTAAARHNVAIFVPGISDSELALTLVTHNRTHADKIEFDTLVDVEHFAELIVSKPKSGLVSIGGGVPRNWAQQIYPYLHLRGNVKDVDVEGYRYGVRITTDRPEFGGLSGCTISESKSWGKYTNRSIDASVICDATIALPILTAALFQRLDKR